MKNLLILFFLVSIFGSAQRSKTDSLLATSEYLSEILNTVNAKNSNKNKQLQKLKIIIKQSSAQEKKFKSNLKEFIPTDNPDHKMMTNNFHLILQSLVLYKSDISNDNDGLSEKKYLNQNIPTLIDKINFHCKLFKEKMNFKTH